MPEELGAVLEAPEITADEVVNEVPEGVAADPAEEVAAPAEEVKGDERTMPQWIRNLKGTDPAAFKAAKADFFGKRAIDEKLKDFDLDGTKGWLEEHGGREAIVAKVSELEGKAAELDAISEKIANGDASLVNDLTPETLSKLAPVVAERWAKDDPEGWGAAMSGVMAATIQQNGIPMFLERMGLMLEVGKTDAIPAMIKQLQEWAGSFQAKAQAPRTAQPQQTDKYAAREQELNTREQQAFNSDMERSVESFRDPLISKELESFTKRRPNDNDAKDLAISTVRSQVVERLKADTAFQKSLNALWQRKDKDGALRLIKSRETAAITEIAPKVGRTIFGNPGTQAAAVPARPAGTPSKADAGFSFTDKAPKPELIDKFRTSDAMIMRGKFILKDGRKLSLEA